MKKLDWYILKKFLGTFFYAILIFAAISIVIDYSEKVDDLVKHKAPLTAILGYFKNFVPYIVALLYPLFVFIATIFFTSKLAYRSEIIAILASGTSFHRFMRPYFIGGLLLGGLSLFSNHYVVPAANRARLRFESRYVHNNISYSDKNVHLRLSKNLYVFVQNYDYKSNMGNQFTAEKVDGTLLIEKVTADRISYDSVKRMWKLYNVTIRTNNGLKEDVRMAHEMMQSYPFVPRDLYEDDEQMFALTTKELNKFIAVQKTRGVENLNMYYVEKHRRSSQPMAGFILTIIGGCIASRKIRGGSGFHLAIGIVLSAVYIMLMQFSTTFSAKTELNPLIAVWIPNMIYGSVAIYLYRKQTT